jgi:predicted short-subunit dehydrogenase-like oxidoreductase (DUF2520 family)
MSVVFIGTGNVASNLASAFKKAGFDQLHIHGRTEQTAKNLAEKLNASFSSEMKDIPPNSLLYIISVSDDAIPELSKDPILKDTIENNLVVHTAGSIPMDILNNLSDNYGVFYPLQTFSKFKPIDFKHIPLCLEASTGFNYDKLSKYAFKISEDVRRINSEQRKYLHLAAVFANNFTNRMFSIAEEILAKEQIPFDILLPLLKETVDKVQNNDPSKVQTGPAIRNDLSVMEKHVELLKENRNLKELYLLISQNIKDNT